MHIDDVAKVQANDWMFSANEITYRDRPAFLNKYVNIQFFGLSS